MKRDSVMAENEYDDNKMDPDSFEHSQQHSEREKGRISIESLEN